MSSGDETRYGDQGEVKGEGGVGQWIKPGMMRVKIGGGRWGQGIRPGMIEVKAILGEGGF